LATIADAIQCIYKSVDKYVGVKDLNMGTARQVCNLPWVPELAYLHRLYPPASIDQIACIASLTGRQPQPDLRTLLAQHNGFDLFNGSLSIFGVRDHWDRTASDVIWLPFDLGSQGSLLNTMIGRDDMLIGGIGPNGQRLVLRGNGSVDRTGSEKPDVLESWPSMADMLICETERFAQYYNTDGRMSSDYIVAEGRAHPWRTDPLVGDPKPNAFNSALSRLIRLFK
jgi:hypothetical protein